MRQKKSRLALTIGLLLVLAGCGQNAPTNYKTVFPEIGRVENLVAETGTAAYRDPYSVIPVVNGKILSCSFQEGDLVHKGQELYVIDSTDLENQITQARLSLESASAAYKQSVDACGDLSVRSHAQGAVTEVFVHAGDFVTAGTPIARVVDSQSMTLTVPFSVADAAAIVKGSEAVVTFLSHSDRLNGAVKTVYDSPTAFAGGFEGVLVEIAFQNPGALTAGASAVAAVGEAACMQAGAVSYATDQAIYATASGQVLKLSVEAGSTVSRGQVVMTIDNAALTNAAVTTKLTMEAAAVSLEQMESKRADYRLLAPVDGIILTRLAKEGDYAAAATPLATLALADSLCVKAQVDEIYIHRIWPGQQARVTFTTDEGQEKTYPAAVSRVDDLGVTFGGVTDYTVELALGDTEGLKAGMNVSVTIVTEQKTDCLRIPSQALTGDAVQVLRGSKAVEVQVTAGISGGGYTEILSGLTPEDAVILP